MNEKVQSFMQSSEIGFLQKIEEVTIVDQRDYV